MNEQKLRFDACCRRALTSKAQQSGIGTLGERVLHAVLKDFFEPDRSCHERKIGRFVADIQNEDGIIEIQTRAFSNLRRKLTAFSEEYAVNVVYPIASVKYLTWVDPETGELSDRRKSPKRGKPWDFLYELYALRPLMPLHGVTFTLIFCEMDEFRLKNGWSKDKKRGGARYERIPTAFDSLLRLEKPEDFAALLPPLPETFTVKDFMVAAKMTRNTASKAVQTLCTLGVIESFDKKGNARIYRRMPSHQK